MDRHEIAQQFQEYFRPEPAESPSLRECTFRIRYEVYCREFGFEREEDCPGGLEQDEYDVTARHCALIHRTTGMPAGTVRLVRPAESPGPLAQLPIQRFCEHSLEHPMLHPGLVPPTECCEISRLAVPHVFRRRRGERNSPWGARNDVPIPEHEMRTFPLIAVALFLAAAALVALNRRPHVFVMMEPRLARLLAQSGMQFIRIGRLVDYHGPRAGFYIYHEDSAVQRMRPELRGLYETILAALARDSVAGLSPSSGQSDMPTPGRPLP